MNILIVCIHGLTSSKFKETFESYCYKNNIEYSIKNTSSNHIESHIEWADVILIAPHLFNDIEDIKSQILTDQIIITMTPFQYGFFDFKGIIKKIEERKNDV